MSPERDAQQVDESFGGCNVTVFGLGRFGGGVGAVRWLCSQGARVTVVDQASAQSLADSISSLSDCRFELHLGRPQEADFTQCDLLVLNPAIPPDNPHVQRARQHGATITTEINLFLRRCPGRVVGITGTVGKSTVTAMTGAVLEAAGKVWVGGNIGRSLLPDLEKISPEDPVVLELSSFQLEHTPAVGISPEIALVTNLAANHLDRHQTLEAYARAKKNIFRLQGPQDVLILNRACPATSGWAKEAPGKVDWFDPSDEPFELALPGRHNQANAQAAWAVARQFGIGREDAGRRLADFNGLPHRLQPVHESRGVKWFNDSKCTTPEGVCVALDAFAPRKSLLIVGGYDKQVGFEELGKALAHRAKAVIAMGQTAPAILSSVESARNAGLPLCQDVEDLSHAVALCAELAQNGDAVLLSPGCASYDMFDNYQQRGEAFVRLVRVLA
jgi:UDP-N-acetylmuramoylalanine--D-glutamate ligase